MSRGPDAQTLLFQALQAAAEAEDCTLDLVSATSSAWASATFIGARHRFDLRMKGSGLEDWLTKLAEQEFTLRGHLVADLAVGKLRRSAAEAEVRLEALTVEAR